MPCNNSGYTDPAGTAAWRIIDFDCACAWVIRGARGRGGIAAAHSVSPLSRFFNAGSNAKALWVANRPMNDEELLQEQVVMSTSSSLGQSVWVYRGR